MSTLLIQFGMLFLLTTLTVFTQMRMVVIHDPKALHTMMVKDQEYFPKGLEPSKCVQRKLSISSCAILIS